MLWISGILGFLSSILFLLSAAINYFKSEYQAKVNGDLKWLMISLCITLGSIFLYKIIIFMKSNKETKKINEIKLWPLEPVTALLRNHKTITYLIRCKQQGKIVYSYFYKPENGEKTSKYVPANITSVHEEDHCYDPRLEEYVSFYNCPYPVLDFILTLLTFKSRIQKWYRIYIPTGTIIEDFSIKS